MLNDAIEVLGWTLLHFVWQGLAAAVLLAALLLVLRRATAQTKYLVTCGVFATMAVAPLATSAWLATHSRNHRTTPAVAVRETPLEIPSQVTFTSADSGVGDGEVGSTIFRNSPSPSFEVGKSVVGEFRKIVDPTPLSADVNAACDGISCGVSPTATAGGVLWFRE